MPITGINHVTLRVRSLTEARKFYELLGFGETGTREGMVFLSVGAHHHHIALMELGPDAEPQPSRRSVGMAHFALTVDTEPELGDLFKKVSDAGYRVTMVTDHRVNRGFYVKDGDGNVVEITFDAPREEWRGLENPFGEDQPYTIPGLGKDE